MATITYVHQGQKTPEQGGFWVTPDAVVQHVKTTYLDTGKMTEVTENSEDFRTKTVIQTFRDDAAKAEFLADPILLQNAENRKAFNAAQSVTDQVTL